MDGLIFRSQSLGQFQPEAGFRSAKQRNAILTRMVREQIIPTLLRRNSECAPGLDLAVKQLATHCLSGDSVAVIASVKASFQNGQNAERLCRDLLAPTARYLGKCWEEDRCTFVEVTLGIAHLETALRAIQPLIESGRSCNTTDTRRILLMPVPGGQHSFGLSMLAAFFTRAGWDVSVAHVDRCQDLNDVIAARPVDVVGFSVSHFELLGTARDAIAVVRTVAGDRAPATIVGGSMLTADPSLAGTLGADGIAFDAIGALQTALKLTRSTGLQTENGRLSAVI